MRNRIIIAMEDQPGAYCLGPMGNPNPTDLIILETNRISFKNVTFYLSNWADAFRSWPNHDGETGTFGFLGLSKVSGMS